MRIAVLSDAHRSWMASLPRTLELAHGVLDLHGSPRTDLTYLLRQWRTGGRAPGD